MCFPQLKVEGESFMKWNLVLNFIIPFIMLFVGHHFKKHPVSDMSTHNGYNTRTSRKTQAHWDYAQSIAPGIFISFGLKLLAVECILNGVLLFTALPDILSVAIGELVGILFLILAFLGTEKKIKVKFPIKS